MKNKLLVTGLCAALFATPAAFAKSKKHHRDHHEFVSHARVTHVEPIYRSKVVHSPREECEYVDVSDRDHGHRHNAAGRMIVGGLVGGAIANEIHGGTNAKIAGAVVGSAIGHDSARHNHRRDHHVEKRCRTVKHRHHRDYIDGYRVYYRYHGEEFVTRMNHRPGKRIKVYVNVEPAHRRHR